MQVPVIGKILKKDAILVFCRYPYQPIYIREINELLPYCVGTLKKPLVINKKNVRCAQERCLRTVGKLQKTKLSATMILGR